MGSASSQSNHKQDVKGDHKHLEIRALSLRAPIFHKSPREKCDMKANHKYCNEEIAKKLFMALDLDGDDQISFEEFRSSPLAKGIPEHQALSVFRAADKDNNGLLNFGEFQQSKLALRLVEDATG